MAHIGSVIGGRFKVIDAIGKGGMGVVWLASDRNLGKYWAIKEIKIDEGQSDKQKRVRIERLYSEADMMKRLDHPAMPRIVDLITENSTLYVVMDYINGTSLDRELKRNGGSFDQDLVVSWALQMCSVLSYLHTQNPPVIYRDMKPSNIMLCNDGSVRLIDFGIAREYKPGKGHDTQVLGTPQYAAPEQMCEDEQSDARTDIYSLGVTIYRLVTAVPTKELAALKPLREINPQLSQGLETIVTKCTQRDPDRRYQTVDDLAYDLGRYTELTDEHVAAQRKKVTRFRAACIGSVACLVLGVVLMVGGSVVGTGQSQDYAAAGQASAISAFAAGGSDDADAFWQSVSDSYRSAKDSDEAAALDSLEEGVIGPWKDSLYSSNSEWIVKKNFNQVTSLMREMAPTDSANYGRYAKLCFQVAQCWYWHAPDTITERARAEAVYEWYAKAVRYGIQNYSTYYADDLLNLDGFAANSLKLVANGLDQDEAKAALIFAALSSYYATGDEGVGNVYKTYWHNLTEVVGHLDDLGLESNTTRALSCWLAYEAIRDTDTLRLLKPAIIEANGGDVDAAKRQVSQLLSQVKEELESLQNDASVEDYAKTAIALDGSSSKAQQSIDAVFSTVYTNNATTGGN